MREVTQRGLDFIIRHEGMRLTPYRDSAGLLTIGVGHLLTRSELSSGKIKLGHDSVRWADGITREQAMAILRNDLYLAEEAAERDGRGLSDNKFDALVSFIFNVGVSAYEGSTLRRCIFTTALDDVPTQMLRWTRAAGVVVAGLVRRRQDEAALWNAAA